VKCEIKKRKGIPEGVPFFGASGRAREKKGPVFTGPFA
jgi:hypothetical protein